jgi:antitoxin Phd
MATWQLQEAKSRFSELVEQTLTEGPQTVTRRGVDTVVVISLTEFKRMKHGGLKNVLLNAPRGKDLDIERSSEPVREIAL